MTPEEKALFTTEEKIGMALLNKKLTIGLAESCTGGLVASRITDVAGSSAYFEAGLVTYANKAKTKFLRVPAAIIAREGAVSAEVAQRMAEGVRNEATVDIGISITGVAGPGGGTEKKPVGTVFIGLAAKEGTFVRQFLFKGDRRQIKDQTADQALKILLEYLEYLEGLP